jgi:hypothetical protein
LFFVMPDGTKIVSLIDQLDAALREAGIERSSFGVLFADTAALGILEPV